MTHTPISVTPEQRANLQTLADFLLNNPVDDFDMVVFRGIRNGPAEDEDWKTFDIVQAEHTCGTVGCAVGHGPAAGIKPGPYETSWWDYAYRAFGASEIHESQAASDLWLWLFDTAWAEADNTARGAGKRILIALEKGVPDNSYNQRWRTAPLEYQP